MHKEVLKAAEMLKKFCKTMEHCRDCPFKINETQGCTLTFYTPASWDLEKEGN